MKNPNILYFFRVVQNGKLNNLEDVEVFEIFGPSMVFVQKSYFLVLVKRDRVGFETKYTLFSFEIMHH